MKYAVKFHSQNPQAPDGIPPKWPWLSQRVNDEAAAGFEAAGWTIMTDEAFAAHIGEQQAAFDGWWKNRKASDNSARLRVCDLLEQKFEHLHPSKIDFRRHLKPNIVLDKRVTMLKNGRPGVAEYFWNNEKICEIEFVFEVDSFGFMTRRTELLGYISVAGFMHEQFAISDQRFVATNPYHARERIRERNEARGLIFDDIKSKLEVFIAVTMLAAGANYGQVLLLGGEFRESYSTRISAWVNTGTPALKAAVQAETAVEFFDWTMPPEFSGEDTAMTVREFVIARLTY